MTPLNSDEKIVSLEIHEAIGVGRGPVGLEPLFRALEPTMTDDEVNILLERFDQTDPAIQRKIIVQFINERAWLETALRELVPLQAHYATLLNDFDGGKRVPFKSPDQWIKRLVQLEKLPIEAATMKT